MRPARIATACCWKAASWTCASAWTTRLAAHGAAIPLPPISTSLDYEAELALVIGKTTRNVSEEEALGAVFGYACFNDATFRDYQRKTSQWTVGKNFDQTGGLRA